MSPAPLVPAFVDLADYQFMPLDVRRLRDSRIAALVTGEEFRSAVLLWCASWHQVPAASLPNDDIELAHLAGFGRVVSEWLKVKAVKSLPTTTPISRPIPTPLGVASA